MNKPLYLIVGKSASGKTTVAEFLEKEKGMKSVQSYSTRKPRYEGETGHTFISDEEFDQLENIIAYTEYHGHRYCSTQKQLDEADVYVVDPPGVETLLERYSNQSRDICIIFFSASIQTRIDRMRNRNDDNEKIIGRLYNDSEYNWWDRISHIYSISKLINDNYKNNLHLSYIDANQDLENVINEVLSIIDHVGG